LGLNTAGNREETVNFQINGITINDQLGGSNTPNRSDSGAVNCQY